MLEALWSDIRFAARTLRKNPLFAAAAIATLALGIGANTAIFSLVDHVILRPLAYRDSGQLYVIQEGLTGVPMNVPPVLPVNAMHFTEWRKNLRSFDEMALIGGFSVNLTGAGEPQRLNAARVSWNLFEMLGARPLLGRTFLQEEDAPGRDHEVVINYRLWKSRFGGDASVIGRKILLNGEPYEIVGVLPASFRFPKLSQLFAMEFAEQRPDIWKPFALRKEEADELGDFDFACIARLRRTASVAQARTELNALQAELARRIPFHITFSAVLVPLEEQITSRVRGGLKLVLGAVTFLLLIACVNLASLLLARGTARKREIAIRSAIGASGRRLLRQMLAESLTLALAGGALAIAVAYAAVRIIVARAPLDVPRIEEVGIDGRVLLFTLGISIAAGVLFGLMPAWSAARQDPQEAMKAGARGTTAERGAGRVRSLLAAAEVSLSAMCLVSGGLLLHSFVKLLNVDRGFQVERLVTVDLLLPDKRYPSTDKRAALLKTLLDKVQALPDVRHAAVANKVPLTGEGENNVVIPADMNVPLTQRPLADIRAVSPDYFQTMGIPLRAGRAFTDADRSHPVALVSALGAAKLWPAQNPLGRELIIGDEDKHPIRMVGIVGDVHGASLEKQPAMTVYVPYWQRSWGTVTLIVETPVTETAAAREIRAAVRQADAQLPVEHFQTMIGRLDESVAQRRFQMELVMLFAICALLLASLGIYGVVAYSVSQRTNEIGVRMALGAQQGRIGRMVLQQGLRPVVIGLGIGVLGSLALGRMLQSLLFGVKIADPLTIAAVIALLLAAAVGALIVPTLRATRVDPLDALRYE